MNQETLRQTAISIQQSGHHRLEIRKPWTNGRAPQPCSLECIFSVCWMRLVINAWWMLVFQLVIVRFSSSIFNLWTWMGGLLLLFGFCHLLLPTLEGAQAVADSDEHPGSLDPNQVTLVQLRQSSLHGCNLLLGQTHLLMPKVLFG